MELDLRLRCDDINEKWRESRFKKLNKPDLQLNVDDITQVKRAKSNLYLSQRNPLVPDYQLPKSSVTMIAPPKFIRDTLDTSDILGSKPFFKFNHMNQRVSNNVDDIARARPRKIKGARTRGERNDSLQVKDITGKQFFSDRQTNPLNPTYTYGRRDQTSTTHKMLAGHHQFHPAGKDQGSLSRYGSAASQLTYDNNGYVVFGEIPGNRPKVFKSNARKKAKDRDFSLRTTDMDLKKKAFQPKVAREIIDVRDIDGAVPNTTVRMKTLHWKRCVNPLNPEYKLPVAKGMYHIDREYECKKEAPPRPSTTASTSSHHRQSRPHTASPAGFYNAPAQTMTAAPAYNQRHTSALAAAKTAMHQSTLARSNSNSSSSSGMDTGKNIRPQSQCSTRTKASKTPTRAQSRPQTHQSHYQPQNYRHTNDQLQYRGQRQRSQSAMSSQLATPTTSAWGDLGAAIDNPSHAMYSTGVENGTGIGFVQVPIGSSSRVGAGDEVKEFASFGPPRPLSQHRSRPLPQETEADCESQPVGAYQPVCTAKSGAFAPAHSGVVINTTSIYNTSSNINTSSHVPDSMLPQSQSRPTSQNTKLKAYYKQLRQQSGKRGNKDPNDIFNVGMIGETAVVDLITGGSGRGVTKPSHRASGEFKRLGSASVCMVGDFGGPQRGVLCPVSDAVQATYAGGHTRKLSRDGALVLSNRPVWRPFNLGAVSQARLMTEIESGSEFSGTGEATMLALDFQGPNDSMTSTIAKTNQRNLKEEWMTGGENAGSRSNMHSSPSSGSVSSSSTQSKQRSSQRQAKHQMEKKKPKKKAPRNPLLEGSDFSMSYWTNRGMYTKHNRSRRSQVGNSFRSGGRNTRSTGSLFKHKTTSRQRMAEIQMVANLPD